MTYWLVLVVVGLGAGTVIDSPRVPIPVSTQLLHVGNFASQNDCMAAAAEATKANGTGSPGASYRLLCIRASNTNTVPPKDTSP
jgi:hypothetical protein